MSVSPDMFITISSMLSMDNVFHCSVWCGCLIGFYGLLRAGNFLRKSVHPHKDKVLSINNVSACKERAIITQDHPVSPASNADHPA